MCLPRKRGYYVIETYDRTSRPNKYKRMHEKYERENYGQKSEMNENGKFIDDMTTS